MLGYHLETLYGEPQRGGPLGLLTLGEKEIYLLFHRSLVQDHLTSNSSTPSIPHAPVLGCFILGQDTVGRARDSGHQIASKELRIKKKGSEWIGPEDTLQISSELPLTVLLCAL